MNMKAYVSMVCIIIMNGCTVSPSQNIQNTALNLSKAPDKNFQQYPGTEINPPAYFACGNDCHPCRSNTNLSDSCVNKSCKS
jgi:hypothetical protein